LFGQHGASRLRHHLWRGIYVHSRTHERKPYIRKLVACWRGMAFNSAMKRS
jgi:hypothetical protein